MEIDTQRVIELVKSVRPFYGPREGVQDNGKRAADFVTQVDFQVQERMRSGLLTCIPRYSLWGEKDNRDIDFQGSMDTGSGGRDHQPDS